MNFFARALLEWHESIDRNLPWKETSSAYNIWLSEIILQQTRVKQGRPYYLRFIDRYPTIENLAAADEQDVFKLWEGLGYYSRARNLLKTAKVIVDRFDSSFPKKATELAKLPGIGPYTSAAIASFAFGEDVAVVDGNVFRVLSRYFNDSHEISSTKGRKHFQHIANRLLPKGQSAAFNQAIMDFGATVCTPKNPSCTSCPLRNECVGMTEGTHLTLPIKKKAVEKKHRYFHYLDLSHCDNMLVTIRTEKDIWKGLYELPMIETSNKTHLEEGWTELIEYSELTLNFIGKQTLSHQIIHTFFYLPKKAKIKNTSTFELIPSANKSSLAFPRSINTYWEYKIKQSHTPSIF